VIQLWDAASGESVHEMTPAFGWQFYLAFSPDGLILVSAAADYNSAVQLWDVATGQE